MSERNEPGRKPDFLAYNVKESHDGKGYWNKVGAGWNHGDGDGIKIKLDNIPLDGEIDLRILREERMEGFKEERQVEEPVKTQGRPRGRSR